MDFVKYRKWHCCLMLTHIILTGYTILLKRRQGEYSYLKGTKGDVMDAHPSGTTTRRNLVQRLSAMLMLFCMVIGIFATYPTLSSTYAAGTQASQSQASTCGTTNVALNRPATAS